MVLGFAYCGGEVLLLKKLRPEWQCGRFNGVGGHIERGELSIEAMHREFKEETSVDIASIHWMRRVHLIGMGWSVGIYRTWLDAKQRDEIRAATDEEPVWIPMSRLWATPVIPNLRWLVPLCYDPDLDVGELIVIRDVR